MSCYDIGGGMNLVGRTVIRLYDGGEITRQAAREIFAVYIDTILREQIIRSDNRLKITCI